MRQIYNAGALGKLIYAEGEYYHYMEEALPSFKEWRVGLPPQWYPTHSNAYYVGASGGNFTANFLQCGNRLPPSGIVLMPHVERQMHVLGNDIARSGVSLDLADSRPVRAFCAPDFRLPK